MHIIIFFIICQFFSFFALQTPANSSLKATIGLKNKTNFFDILVYGDELPGIAAAIMAKRVYQKPLRIALIRPNLPQEPLAGLITRAGLAYLDRNQMNGFETKNISGEFYEEFLQKAQVKQIALDPVLADKVLHKMLDEAQIEIISDTQLEPLIEENKIVALQIKGKQKQFRANIYIDASQNADLARAAGLKYNLGFAGLGLPEVTLPISPVFITQNLSVQKLQEIEKNILQNPFLMQQIEEKVKEDIQDTAYADWLLENLYKPMFVGEDYIDVRSIALGVLYHLQKDKTYNLKAGFLFDRANIAILKNGNLSWNAFLYKASPQEILNNGSKPSPEMLAELKSFENWLGKFQKNTKVIPPKEVYIRHLLNISDVMRPLSSEQILEGGLPAKESIGSFCYYFDLRGGLNGLKGKMLKPVFNFGFEHSLTKLENLAVVGPAAGYTNLAPAIGRILELNTHIGAGIGAAAALALQENKPLNQINSSQIKHLNNFGFLVFNSDKP